MVIRLAVVVEFSADVLFELINGILVGNGLAIGSRNEEYIFYPFSYALDSGSMQIDPLLHKYQADPSQQTGPVCANQFHNTMVTTWLVMDGHLGGHIE